MGNVSLTEHRIYESGDHGRGMGVRLHQEAQRRRLRAGHHRAGFVWQPDLWVDDGSLWVAEIKVCRTADPRSPHKNCSTPFATTLGRAVTWQHYNLARVSFIFVDLVAGATGEEHTTLVGALTVWDIQVRVMTHLPRDAEIKELLDWVLSHPGG